MNEKDDQALSSGPVPWSAIAVATTVVLLGFGAAAYSYRALSWQPDSKATVIKLSPDEQTSTTSANQNRPIRTSTTIDRSQSQVISERQSPTSTASTRPSLSDDHSAPDSDTSSTTLALSDDETENSGEGDQLDDGAPHTQIDATINNIEDLEDEPTPAEESTDIDDQ